jgi:hypothetical protein
MRRRQLKRLWKRLKEWCTRRQYPCSAGAEELVSVLVSADRGLRPLPSSVRSGFVHEFEVVPRSHHRKPADVTIIIPIFGPELNEILDELNLTLAA